MCNVSKKIKDIIYGCKFIHAVYTYEKGNGCLVWACVTHMDLIINASMSEYNPSGYHESFSHVYIYRLFVLSHRFYTNIYFIILYLSFNTSPQKCLFLW